MSRNVTGSSFPAVRLDGAAGGQTLPVSDKILERLGLAGATCLGRGGEATVYAVDADTVVRVPHTPLPPGFAAERAAFLREIESGASSVGFAVPSVLRVERVLDREVTYERRHAGVDVDRALAATDDPIVRRSIVRNLLEATAAIGDIHIRRPHVGELLGLEPLRASTISAFLVRRLQRSLDRAGGQFAAIDAVEIVESLSIGEQPSLVHFDAFSGNVLVDGTTVTAVIDFGPSAALADRRLDPLLCAVYLDNAMTKHATDADRAVAQMWLDEHGLARWFEPARRFAAAFWSFAHEDIDLFEWCVDVLLRADENQG